MISFIFSFPIWLRKTIGLVYLLMIALLSLMPVDVLPDFTVNKGIDKVIHVGMYLGLALVAGWSFNITRKRMKPVFYLLAGVFMWGVLMEILQRTMHNGRNFDFRDMVANLSGAIIGLLIFRHLDKMRETLKDRNETIVMKYPPQ